MIKIKLSRVGKKKQATFRLLVIEGQKDPWGTFIENIGTYNPHINEGTPYQLKEDRVKYWLSVGAVPTDSVHNILVSAGFIKAKKRNVSALGSEVRAANTKKKDEESKAKKAAADAAKAEKAAAKATAEAAEKKVEEAKAEEKK